MSHEPISETGPWEVHASKLDRDVYLFSDDFTHDVSLKISGDFETREQKIEYAHELARRLNTWKESNGG